MGNFSFLCHVNLWYDDYSLFQVSSKFSNFSSWLLNFAENAPKFTDSGIFELASKYRASAFPREPRQLILGFSIRLWDSSKLDLSRYNTSQAPAGTSRASSLESSYRSIDSKRNPPVICSHKFAVSNYANVCIYICVCMYIRTIYTILKRETEIWITVNYRMLRVK